MSEHEQVDDDGYDAPPRPVVKTPGGVVHTYQKYDPVAFPSPTQPPSDLVTPAFEHLLFYGDSRELTDEDLANAVRLDPSQIKGLGPSIDALREMLLERKQKILETHETDSAQEKAANQFRSTAQKIQPPKKLDERFKRAVRDEQLRDLENLWYYSGDDNGPFARDLVKLADQLGRKYQVDELAAKYPFTGRDKMTVDKALEVKAELEAIDKLLKQLEEARKNAQIGLIDMEELSKFAEPGDLDQLSALQQQVQDYLREAAERQGLEKNKSGSYDLTPKAFRLFQSKLLESIFSHMQASRSGRHGNVMGEGAVELPQTKPYEFGDSVAQMDVVQSMVNAMLRESKNGAPTLPVRMKPDDIEIFRTRNNPKAATVVLLDMSGSMRYNGQYVNVKRMGLALDGHIRKEYPGDYLQFIEMFSFAKPRHISEIAGLMPKPVTVYDP
ncbi:MAG: hypothetical protein ACRDD1_02965, partial [Planctomycetia bacterium]